MSKLRPVMIREQALLSTATGNYILILLLVLCVSGCGEQSSLAPVTGSVTYQGKPLASGTLTFVKPGSRQAMGEIENGIITSVSTKGSNDGLAPGEYQVAINAFDLSKNLSPPPSVIPKHYGDYSKSGLTATIELGTTNKLDFELE